MDGSGGICTEEEVQRYIEGGDYCVGGALIDCIIQKLYKSMHQMNQEHLIDDESRYLLFEFAVDDLLAGCSENGSDEFRKAFQNKLSEKKKRDTSSFPRCGRLSGSSKAEKHHPKTNAIIPADKKKIQTLFLGAGLLDDPKGVRDMDPESLWSKPPAKLKEELVNVLMLFERDIWQGPEGTPPTMRLPDSVRTSSFLIFDALKDTPDRVIEKLTSALTLVGGEDEREMGFQETEQQRLKYAWELCMLFRHNAELVEQKARWLQRFMALFAFMTTFCAVLLNASNETRPDDIDMAESSNATDIVDTLASNTVPQIPEYVTLPQWGHSLLALLCAVVPMLSSFALAVIYKFGYTKSWVILKVAGERVASEIYLYRARVGEYTQGSKEIGRAHV
jgi:hypothetical protein